MTFTQALIGLAAAVAMSGAQAAAVTTMPGGSLGNNPSGVFFYGLGDGATNTYSFKLLGSSAYKLSTSFAALFDTVYVNSITVTGGESFSQTVSNPLTDTVSFTGLSAGSYTISFATSVAGRGKLIGTVSAQSFTMAVPEGQTATLALAGVGLVACLRRRRPDA